MNDYIDEKKTGYPSIDKPWLKYYTESARNSRLSSKTMYKYLFDKNADHMDQTALLYFGRNISYKELIENIKRAASSFYKMGVRKGDVVSFCTVTVPEVIYSFYGLNMIGAIGNMIDPRTSVEGIAEYIKESNSKYLIILDVLQSRLKDLINDEIIKKAIVISPADSMPGVMSFFYKLAKHYNIIENKCVIWKDFINIGKDFPFEGRPYEKGLPVSIMHTGGTTGNPKGVLFSDDGYNHLNDEFAHYRMEPKRGEIFLNIMPPFIAYGMAVGIHEMLCCGSKVVLIPRFDPEKFDSLIIKYKPQHFWGVPTHLDGLRFSKKLFDADLSYLITAGVGGDAIKKESEIAINQFLKKHDCSYSVTKGYGMTEVNSAVCACDDLHNEVGSVGIPLIHSVIAAFEPGTHNELKYGERGEICIHTPSAMLGYLNKPDETKSILQKHPDGLLWVHSGDIGYVTEEGYVYIVDRMKRMIIREDGFKVYPSVIENVICECTGVRDCAVVGIRNEKYSQGVNPKAFITMQEKAEDSEKIIKEIQEMCKEKLAEYMIPVEIEIMDELPLTKVGKIDYKVLEAAD